VAGGGLGRLLLRGGSRLLRLGGLPGLPGLLRLLLGEVGGGLLRGRLGRSLSGGLLAGLALGLDLVLVLRLQLNGGVALGGQLADEVLAVGLSGGDGALRVAGGGLGVGLGGLGRGLGGLLVLDLLVGDGLQARGHRLEGLDVLDLGVVLLAGTVQGDVGVSQVRQRLAGEVRGERVERVAALLVGLNDDRAQVRTGGLGVGGGGVGVGLGGLGVGGGRVEVVDGGQVVLVGELRLDLSVLQVAAFLGELGLQGGDGVGGRALGGLGAVDIALVHGVGERRGRQGACQCHDCGGNDTVSVSSLRGRAHRSSPS